MHSTLQTTCPYCGVGCGIQADINPGERSLTLRGDPTHPANFGRLCSKGSALGETIQLEGRLLQPMIDGHSVDWDTALDRVAETFAHTIAEYGADSVAFYGSGQLLTEDYYVANKLMKGFIGSANMDTNSRLCMSSSVAGHKRAFGADSVPGCYADYELAELVVLIGSNTAWCHPVSFQRLRAAKDANPALKIVVIDPRKTASCDLADLHLPLASGSDALLFNGLLQFLAHEGSLDLAYIQAHTEGFETALAQAQTLTLSSIAQQCALKLDDLLEFYRWFAETPKVMSLYSQGINQSSSGTDKVNAIINCHLATGRIGKPGCGPFSLTGQPNAMGGREVGGLAHQLAAHMDFAKTDDVERVARFWQTRNIATAPGYPAVALFDAIAQGRVKAVWIMGTNPVVSLPNANQVIQALKRCPFVVVSDCIADTDTTRLAHVLLPAQGWSEKDGTVTNSERRISRQRALFPAAGAAKPDWWILSQVAQRMGFAEAFSYSSPAEIFREHAALSGFENNGNRDFDISGLATLSDLQYQNLQPIQWPVNPEFPEGRARLFADGQFFTDSGKAQFIAITPRPPCNPPTPEFPLILNTGRLRDQWHTMTRTALAAKLNQHSPEPFVEIHPQDAQQHAVTHQGLAELRSAWGTMLARVKITENIQPGNIFVPMHWGSTHAKQGRMGALVNPNIDPISKQPENKHTPVSITAYQPKWQGFMLTRTALDSLQPEYWVKIKNNASYRYELAGEQLEADWASFAKQQLNPQQLASTWQEYLDPSQGNYRAAQFVNGQLVSIIFISQQSPLPERDWLTNLFNAPELSAAERKALLTGLPPLGTPDTGSIICACFNVGQTTITDAIQKLGLKTHHEVGQCLKAGTNCGSCVPEIKNLLG